jgi:hypothetical protein
MKESHTWKTWFMIVSIVLIGFGIIYCIFGLKILPVKQSVLIDWESAIYGSIMIGWGITLCLIGKIAFERKDIKLLRILLLGIGMWLFLEALYSALLGVYFNAGVDICVFILFAIPIVKAISLEKKQKQ